jgi:hypothetical protein
MFCYRIVFKKKLQKIQKNSIINKKKEQIMRISDFFNEINKYVYGKVFLKIYKEDIEHLLDKNYAEKMGEALIFPEESKDYVIESLYKNINKEL